MVYRILNHKTECELEGVGQGRGEKRLGARYHTVAELNFCAVGRLQIIHFNQCFGRVVFEFHTTLTMKRHQGRRYLVEVKENDEPTKSMNV